MWNAEQWELFGMLAHLLALDNCHAEYELCELEAHGESEMESMKAGEAEMAVWLRLYVKRGFRRNGLTVRQMAYMPNPLTVH